MPYARFGERLRAWLIDFVVCAILAAPFALLLPAAASALFRDSETAFPLRRDPRVLWTFVFWNRPWLLAEMLALRALVSLVPGVYYAILETGPRQATLGRRALGLVTVQADGSRVSFPRSLARFMIKAVGHFTAFPLGFLALLPIWAGRRQAAHDWLTGVVVVHRGEGCLLQRDTWG